ncbi:MAG: hypothetical protein U9O54_03990 [Chloroflexota bacterium]|nr:hypothetical protein [Chloroflexota bacterium]
MSKRTLLFFLLFLLGLPLAACVPAPVPSHSDPDMASLHAQHTLDVARAYRDSTQIALDSLYQSTQAAANVRATEVASTAVNATLQADIAGATATARIQATNDFLMVRQTQVALDIQSTADANAVAAAQRVQDAQAEIAELAAERERMMNKITAVIPYLAGGVIGGVLLFLLIRWGINEADRRKVFTNKEGVPQGVVDVSRQGGVSFTMTDRMPSPTVHSDRQGNIIFPQAVNLALQGQTTALALLRGALASETPKQALEIIQHVMQGLPQLPQGGQAQGQIIDVQVVDVSSQTAKNWMTDVKNDFIDGDTL